MIACTICRDCMCAFALCFPMVSDQAYLTLHRCASATQPALCLRLCVCIYVKYHLRNIIELMQFKFGYIYPRCNPHRLRLYSRSHTITESFNCKTGNNKLFDNLGKWKRRKKASKRNYRNETIDDNFFRQSVYVCVCRRPSIFRLFVHFKCCSDNRGRSRSLFFSPSKCVSREMLYICVTASCCRVESLH